MREVKEKHSDRAKETERETKRKRQEEKYVNGSALKRKDENVKRENRLTDERGRRGRY